MTEDQTSELTLTVDDGDGPTEITVDLDFNHYTLQEHVVLETHLPPNVYDSILDGTFKLIEVGRPSVLRICIYAKLRTLYPGLGIDDFDLDMGEVLKAI